MKKITQFAVNSPVTITMFVLGVVLLGVISLERLGVDLFPDMSAPRIFVEIKAGERPPEEIERQYIENIEAQIIKQKGVTQVSSVSKTGSARVTVEYSWNRDMDEAFLELQKALTSYSQNSELDEFTITQHDPNASPVMLVAMRHDQIEDMNELRKVAQNYIRNELIRLDGIAEVELSGDEESYVEIETNEYLLEAFGLTTDGLASQIANYNQNVSGGSIVEMGTKYVIKGVSLLHSVEDIENIVVANKRTNPQSTSAADIVPVFMKEVAKVRIVNKEPVNIVRINGERCLGLAIYKETRYNTVQAVEELKSALETIEKALPGYSFTIVNNQGQFIDNAINEVQETAIYGIIFAVFVLFLFLRRIGVTFIISIAIPISIIATFNLMYFNGLSLNIMTLGGLALGAGMLVDNAIIVVENIFRKMEDGMRLKDAAIEGTAEVGGAIIAATLTTIVVFLPIVYLHGASGELFKDQALTVAFSLIASIFVALFVIPMLVSKLLRPKANKKVESVKMTSYGRFLEKILKYRWGVVALSVVLLAIGVYLVPVVGSEYIPKSDSGEFSIELTLPEGTELERTSATLHTIEQMILEAEGDRIEMIYSHAGVNESGSDDKTVFANENTGSLKLILKDGYRDQSEGVIQSLGGIFDNLEEIETRFIRDETALQATLGTDEAPVKVEVSGKDLDEIERINNEIFQKLTTINEIYNLKSSIEKGSPEVDVVIDRFKAGLYNLNVNQIISQIQNKLSGKDAGDLDNEGELKEILIKLPKMSLMEFQNIRLDAGNQIIRLDEVASFEISHSPKEIIRKDQERISYITAQIAKGEKFDHVIEKVRAELDSVVLPADYKISVTGEEEKRQEAMANLSFALILSIVLVYMVLASQFESLVHPFTILLTIPLAGIGAVVAFFILGISFNMMGYIGIIMLAGIAVNDSIILVDAINQFKAQGIERSQAIIMAGQNRIRPILMTSITTILALLPLTLGFGEGAALRAPMAVAVIGGLVTSTLLTLVVIPSVYSLIDGLFNRAKN
jgi:HAE1 family hydrophobic/amphiphilic exporter-1